MHYFDDDYSDSLVFWFGFSNKKKIHFVSKILLQTRPKKRNIFQTKRLKLETAIIRRIHMAWRTTTSDQNKKKESLKVKNEPENKFGKTKPLQTISRPYLYLYLCLSVFFSC